MRYLYITILAALFFSCDNEEFLAVDFPFNDSDLVLEIPILKYPTDNLICTNFDLEFKWDNSYSVFGGPYIYSVEIAKTNDFKEVLFNASTTDNSFAFTLENETAYFWRVKARDKKGYESPYSPVQSFFTEPIAIVNTLPVISSVITPSHEQNISGSNITLGWSATDADEDALTYDVYFGETNPPALVADNTVASSYDVTIAANKTYYWRVVAKDTNQGVTISQIWSFDTN